jgi:class 3 adenylate cyclase/tetratricopeptide (TPR) repeat protein
MEFRILGALEVLADGRPVDLGGLKQRALLAVLVLNRNRVVSRDRLIDALWDTDPPETAAKALQVYISGLRKALGKERLQTKASGYLLRVGEGEVDIGNMERFAEEGRFDDALTLWRGPPLADFAHLRFAQGEIARLEELRLTCMEERIDSELAAGRHQALVGELEALVREHPLRQRLRGQLMLALYRSGRDAEALEAYRAGRRTLVDEIGIEPSRALQDLEGAILRQDTCLDLEPANVPVPVTAAEPSTAPQPAAQEPEERKVVTVMFADLVGFTGRAEQLDPEDARAHLSQWYACVRTEIERFGGVVEKFVGDAVMGLFGAPVARGDDAERAVRAALSACRAVKRLNEAQPDLQLRCRIGVNTGEALVVPDARLREGEGMVVGDVVNTASRLQSLAPVDRVLVGDETRRATHLAVEYDDAGLLDVSGKAERVRAWLAVQATLEPQERRPSTAPFVGRVREFDILSEAWRRANAERRPQLMTVLGSPGIGKTRLCAEFAATLEAEGAQVLHGRALPYGETAGQSPFARQVKRVAAIFDNDAASTALEKLEQATAALLGPEQGAEIVSPLAVLVGLAPVEASIDRQVTYYAARRFVEGLAAERPALLVFEDIQWADDQQLELLAYLAARVRDVPLMLLAIARPELSERLPGWGGVVPAYSGIALEPLSEGDSHELAAHLLGRDADEVDELAVRVATRSEGHPLFIEELVASLKQGAASTAEELPSTVRGIIAARLDSLPPVHRSALLDAAVVGKVFWRGALVRSGRSEDDLVEILDALESRELVRRQPACRIEGDQEFLFKHMLIRDVAYATLSRAARRERHAAVAAFLEQASGERAAEWSSTLAHHWREAGAPERELHYVLLAAERTWPEQAVVLFERALELTSADGPDRRSVLLQRSLALERASEYSRSAGELEALLPELEDRDLFAALRARARCAFWLGDAEGARCFAEQAAAVAAELGDRQLEAVTLAFFGTLRSSEGRLEKAVELGRRAVAAWSPGADAWELAEAHTWLALENYWLGRYPAALEASRRMEAVAAKLAGFVETNPEQPLVLTGLGRHEEALALFAERVAVHRDLDLAPRWLARTINMWAGTLRELGEHDEARTLNEEAIELAQGCGFVQGEVSGKIDLLFSDLAAGEVGRAESAWPDLWETAEQTFGAHEWLWKIRLAQAKADIALAGGKLEEAAAAAAAALERARSHGRVKYEVSARTTIAEALLALGRGREAVHVLREAQGGADGLGNPPARAVVAAALGRALLAIGADEDAETAFERGRADVEAFCARLDERHMATFRATPAVSALLALGRSRGEGVGR